MVLRFGSVGITGTQAGVPVLLKGELKIVC